MARAPDERVGKAKELYQQGVKLVEIASQLNVPAGTVRRWKSIYKWDGERSDNNNERSEKKTKSKEKAFVKKAAKILEEAELTEKQRLFCLYYIKNFNATLAAIKAGYEPKWASEIGYQQLQKTTVKKEIQRLKDMKKESIMLNEDDIIERYMNIAFADMTDFVSFGREEVPVIGPFGPVVIEDEKTGKKTVLTQIINEVKFKESNQVDGGLICEVSQGKNGIKIKLEDRQKALDWLARYFIMYPLDRHRIDYDSKRLELEKSKANDNNEDALDKLDEVLKALGGAMHED